MSALLTWDDVARAVEALPEEQRAIAAEIIDKERGVTDAGIETSDGPWYLEKAEVAGHVGIGERPVSVAFAATNGLTIVSARNGTGKSSLVHGIRRAISNGSAESSGVVEENVHCSRRSITVTVTNGKRTVDIVCDDSGIRWNETDAQPGAAAPKAWVDAFERYLPILLHSELAPIIEKPSDLHKFLKQALSLGVLDRMLKASDGIRKDGASAKLALDEPRRRMERSLAAIGDETLKREVVAAGSVPSEAVATRLRQMVADVPRTAPAMPMLPSPWTVDRNDIEAITQAVAGLDEARAQVVSGADRVQEILGRLLSADGDYVENLRSSDTCPVCGTSGVAWADRARGEFERLRGLLATVNEAKAPVAEGVRRLRGYAPPRLSQAAADALRGLHEPGTEEYIQQWHRLQEHSDRLGADRLTAEAVRQFGTVSAELAVWYENMVTAIQARHNSAVQARATVGADVMAWLDAVAEARARIVRGAAAEKLSNTVTQWIKDARDVVFDPIREEVVRIWQGLNADADLTLTNVGLAGGVRQAQKVVYELAVDGTPVPGGSGRAEVLSTGQRNALSLAAYLPRAAQATSPFGFLILDDPIHAFDSFRVRFLATELIRLAERYQVIVFTHDDRLWREVRAQDGRPTHVRLRRRLGQRSLVEAENVTRPAEHLLLELEAVLSSEARPQDAVGTAEARALMALALCRQAVDTAVVSQVEILVRKAGGDDDAVANALRGKHTTRDQLAELNQRARAVGLQTIDLSPYQGTIAALNNAAHGAVPLPMDERALLRDTRRLVRRVHEVVG